MTTTNETVNVLTDTEIKKGKSILTQIANTRKKLRSHYLAFGALWIKVKEALDGNKQKMGAYREEHFASIDAQTASYSAEMFRLWDKGLEAWTLENKPNVNNPRPLVQAYKNALEAIEQKKRDIAAEEERKAEEKKVKQRLAAMNDIERKKEEKRIQLEKEKLAAEIAEKDKEEKEEKLKAYKKKIGIKEESPKTLNSAQICTQAIQGMNAFITLVQSGKAHDSQIAEFEKRVKAIMGVINTYHADIKVQKAVSK